MCQGGVGATEKYGILLYQWYHWYSKKKLYLQGSSKVGPSTYRNTPDRLEPTILLHAGWGIGDHQANVSENKPIRGYHFGTNDTVRIQYGGSSTFERNTGQDSLNITLGFLIGKLPGARVADQSLVGTHRTVLYSSGRCKRHTCTRCGHVPSRSLQNWRKTASFLFFVHVK